jgi:hypothetical protein
MATTVIAISLRGQRGRQGRRQNHYSRAQYFAVHRILLGLHCNDLKPTSGIEITTGRLNLS